MLQGEIYNNGYIFVMVGRNLKYVRFTIKDNEIVCDYKDYLYYMQIAQDTVYCRSRPRRIKKGAGGTSEKSFTCNSYREVLRRAVRAEEDELVVQFGQLMIHDLPFTFQLLPDGMILKLDMGAFSKSYILGYTADDNILVATRDEFTDAESIRSADVLVQTRSYYEALEKIYEEAIQIVRDATSDPLTLH